EGCRYCGSHNCPTFYEYTNGKCDVTHCPEYDVTKDPDEYCQTCHLPYGDGPGYCDKHLLGYDKTCERCNQFVPGGSCHHCTVAPPEAELVTFTFDANGGSLNGFPETIVGTKDGSVLLSNYPSPVRDGYIFRGWAITKTVPMDLWEFYVCAAASVSWGMNYYAIWEKA
ncbi:MAG: InlB B-repeat-containing protein, partial [Bacteroidaceae bacterium]|nr:InlB B-repeat-containing protein [Bacteroidaceae bacterium]